MLKEKLEQRKCFPTAWGKLIPEEEAYRQLNRQIAAMTANLFQVMRIFELTALLCSSNETEKRLSVLLRSCARSRSLK